jgi:hypothetical protein
MSRSRLPLPLAAMVIMMVSGCTAPGPSVSPDSSGSPAIRPEDIVGRWGYAAYYNEGDRARIEAAARAQCSRPAIINRGPSGGIMMPIANQAKPQEQRIKSGPGGKNYIGPPGEPGGADDSEILTFDGKILVTRTVAADEGGHLNSIYVRCKA